MDNIHQKREYNTNDWLDLEYPEPDFKYDRCIITKKIQSIVGFLDEFIGVKDEELSVLDLGCGSGGLFPELMKRNYKIVGLDISEKQIHKAKRLFEEANGSIELIVSDIINCPLKNKKEFDVVICSEVIEHLDSPEKCIDVIGSLLRDKGLAIITIPWLWDITSGVNGAILAILNRMLDHIHNNRNGLFSKLIFSSSSAENVKARWYIPRGFSRYSAEKGGKMHLVDYMTEHLQGTLDFTGHKHWCTPGEWMNMLTKANLKILDWTGDKVIPFVIAERTESFLQSILPRNINRYLTQHVVIAAMKCSD